MSGGVAREEYRVLEYGADPTGQEDSWYAIQAAITSEGGLYPGRVPLPPGVFLLERPLVIQPSTSSTEPMPVPLLEGSCPPGEIGDGVGQTSTTTLVAGPSFPVGQALIQFLGQTAGLAPTGGGVRNLALRCNDRASGILVHQPRRSVFENLAILNAAAPAAPADQPFEVSALAAFSVVQSSGTASAYNRFANILVAFAGADSFQYATTGKDSFFGCFSLDPGQAGGSANNYYVTGGSSWYGCGYSGGDTAWYVGTGIPILISGSLIGVGTVNGPAVVVYAQAMTDSNPLLTFDGCRLWCNPAAGSGVAGAVVRILPGGGDNLANIVFSRCSFQARGNQTTPTITAFVWVESGVTGTVAVENCVVNGTPATAPFVDQQGGVLVARNVQGFSPATVATPSVPAASTTVTNDTMVDVDVYIAGGAGGTTSVNGTSTGVGNGAFFVPAGGTIDLGAYTTAPTWVWVGR